MDILFIDPPWIIENDANLWKKVRSCLPSLGIASIAGFLEQHGCTASILDCTAEQLALQCVPARLAEFQAPGPRFIGITATSAVIHAALEIARIAKSAFPECKVILGGVHPTVEPESVLNWEGFPQTS